MLVIGQLISEGLFGVILLDQNSNEIVLRIPALTSKSRSDQNKKGTLITNQGLFNIII